MVTKKSTKQSHSRKSSSTKSKKSSSRSKQRAESPESIASKILKDAEALLRSEPKSNAKGLSQARDIIKRLIIETDSSEVSLEDKILFVLCCNLSIRSLPGYATLDSGHINQINALIDNVKAYVNDASQKRPLNFLMLASPGAGKSHFIKRIAGSLHSHNIDAITFNMAGLQRNEDLIPPLDAARNLKVEDRIPLLFLDEFDSAPSNIPLLLPLLWDGELNLGQRDLKLGKVVIVLAGSDPSLPITMDQARSMRLEAAISNERNPKVIDLLSRINGGVVPIPPFYDPSHEVDRRFDKVCVAAQLLRQRFGRTLTQVPFALLRFLAKTEFRYGVRSIAHLIDLIPYKKDAVTLKIDDLQLPIDDPLKLKASSLTYHLLHDDQAHGVTKIWQEVSVSKELLPISIPRLEYLEVGLGSPKGLLEFILARVIREVQSTNT
jgi:hypothetical protein